MTQRIRTRIAPSPTGDPHVGTAYMALFNMVFAKHHGGDFLLRIEDTDRQRSRVEYEQRIFDALHWCGLQWDEGPDVGGPKGPYRQSERTEIYQKYAQELIDKGMAYRCFATADELVQMREEMRARGERPGYDRRYRNLTEEEVQERIDRGESFVVRLKVPLTGECVYEDAIKGTIRVPYADVDDQVLLKSDGFPTYHLANVVDDHLMEITHVIRGDEWMASTPKHVFLYEAFGWECPTFMHMPLLLGVDGKKLSKRRNPTSIFYYRDSGYMPEAFCNFLSLMGYSMPEDREVYSKEELISSFSLQRVGSSGAVFDVKKLDWINQHYLINHLSPEQLWERIRAWAFGEERMGALMQMVQSRIKNFAEFFELCDYLFVQNLPYTEELFAISGQTQKESAALLQTLVWFMEEREAWTGPVLFEASKRAAEVFGVNHKKKVMPLLFASLMGKRKGPPLFDSVPLLGQDIVRARLMSAIAFLGGLSKKELQDLRDHWDRGERWEG